MWVLTLYVGRSYYRDRLFIAAAYLGFALDEQLRDISFFENLKIGAPKFVVGPIAAYNDFINYLYEVITASLYFFIGVCVPLLCGV
jgi:hypothetical protein